MSKVLHSLIIYMNSTCKVLHPSISLKETLRESVENNNNNFLFKLHVIHSAS